MTNFRGIPNNYANDQAETPFLRAKQEWDNRFGSLIKQARNWRVAYFLSALLSIALCAGLVLVSNQRRIIPVYVGIDRDKGEARYLGAVESKPFIPSENETKFFLSELIRLTRSVPSDQVVLKQQWLRAYKFLRKPAANVLNDEAKRPSSPLNKLGESFVTVQPLSIVKVPDSASYQVRWQETVYKKGGQKLDDYSMLGTFEVEFSPPDDEDTLKENPLGMFVKTFNWNREL